MAIQLANNASTVLASSISSTDLVLVIAPGDGALFPSLIAGDWFPATIVAADGREIVRVTGRYGDSLTVLRAQENTAARAFPIGSRVELRLTAGAFVEMVADKLDRAGGTLTGNVTSTAKINAHELQVDSQAVWHSGNLNPDTKLAKTGVQTLSADRFTLLGEKPKFVLNDDGGMVRVLTVDETDKELRVCTAIDGTGIIFKLTELGDIETPLFPSKLSVYIQTKATDAATAAVNAMQTTILASVLSTYIADVRLGAYVNAAPGSTEYGSGYVVTSGFSFRPVQIKRGGSWVTVFNA